MREINLTDNTTNLDYDIWLSMEYHKNIPFELNNNLNIITKLDILTNELKELENSLLEYSF